MSNSKKFIFRTQDKMSYWVCQYLVLTLNHLKLFIKKTIRD